MQTKTELPFFTLLLMISFASVNAVLYTPALPEIAKFFAVSDGLAQQTVTWFLIGYAVGQLVYGPLANRFGRKPTIYLGIGLQIVSSLVCILAGWANEFSLLQFGRFFQALGSGVGLKMTFTLVNECYEAKVASAKIAYLMLSFAITPGLGVALGGILITYFDWTSCFYATAIYGLILLLLASQLPETLKILDRNALKIKHMYNAYSAAFKNFSLLNGGLLMGLTTSFVYGFAALAPFVAINQFGMSTTEYGFANLIPLIGLVIGSFLSSKLTQKYSLSALIWCGILLSCVSVIFMTIAAWLNLSILISLFLPTLFIYLGITMILANASAMAMANIQDKSHGAAVMSFLNMGLATLVVLNLGIFVTSLWLVVAVYSLICIAMIGLFSANYLLDSSNLRNCAKRSATLSSKP